MNDPEFTVRPFREGDREEILSLADRLATGIAPWIDDEAFRIAARGWVDGSIEAIGDNATVLVAVDRCGKRLGFASATCRTHFTGIRQAYVGEMVVAREAEGRGVGRQIMRAIEDWALDHDCRQITLETGAGNLRGRAFYDRLGFQEESVTLTRVLAPTTDGDAGP